MTTKRESEIRDNRERHEARQYRGRWRESERDGWESDI